MQKAICVKYIIHLYVDYQFTERMRFMLLRRPEIPKLLRIINWLEYDIRSEYNDISYENYSTDKQQN